LSRKRRRNVTQVRETTNKRLRSVSSYTLDSRPRQLRLEKNNSWDLHINHPNDSGGPCSTLDRPEHSPVATVSSSGHSATVTERVLRERKTVNRANNSVALAVAVEIPRPPRKSKGFEVVIITNNRDNKSNDSRANEMDADKDDDEGDEDDIFVNATPLRDRLRKSKICRTCLYASFGRSSTCRRVTTSCLRCPGRPSQKSSIPCLSTECQSDDELNFL
jgi:hypothetical protein